MLHLVTYITVMMICLTGHLRCVLRGRLTLVVTDVRRSLKQVPLTDFADNKELIEANMASVHVPFFLDFKPFSWYRCV